MLSLDSIYGLGSMRLAKKKASGKRGTAGRKPSLFRPPAADVGRTVSVAVKTSSDHDILFTLTDGTKLYAKVVPNGISRSLDKYNPNGDPVYLVQAGLLLRTEVPKKLRRRVKP